MVEERQREQTNHGLIEVGCDRARQEHRLREDVPTQTLS